jgi:hypothetical protein
MHVLVSKSGIVFDGQVHCPPINVCGAGQATHNKPARFSPMFTGQVHSPPITTCAGAAGHTHWPVDPLSTKLRLQRHMFRIGSTWAFTKHVGLLEVELPVDADTKPEPPPIVEEPPNRLDIFRIAILKRLALVRGRLGTLTLGTETLGIDTLGMSRLGIEMLGIEIVGME